MAVCSLSVPAPPPGDLKITGVTHSTMKLNWDAAPGAVRKYTVTYKPQDGEPKEVRQRVVFQRGRRPHYTRSL